MPHIQEIFLAAIEIDDLQQRADYVARECGEDLALHRKVQALLTAHERSGEFLDVPALQQMAGGPNGCGRARSARTSSSSERWMRTLTFIAKPSNEPRPSGRGAGWRSSSN